MMERKLPSGWTSTSQCGEWSPRVVDLKPAVQLRCVLDVAHEGIHRFEPPEMVESFTSGAGNLPGADDPTHPCKVGVYSDDAVAYERAVDDVHVAAARTAYEMRNLTQIMARMAESLGGLSRSIADVLESMAGEPDREDLGASVGPPKWLPLIRNARELREADQRTIPHGILLMSVVDPGPAQPNGSRVYYVNRKAIRGPRLEMFGSEVDWRFADPADDDELNEYVGFPLRVVGLEYTPLLPGLNWPDENGQWRV